MNFQMRHFDIMIRACIIGVITMAYAEELENFCSCKVNVTTSCHCTGDFTAIPPIPYPEVHSLQLHHGKLRGLDDSSLDQFLPSLAELSITHMEQFTYVEEDAFAGLKKLKFLKITHTGLEEAPYLEGVGKSGPFNAVSLEWNKIRRAQVTGIQTVELFLGYNAIKTVDGYAFNGSEMSRLSLRGNRMLSDLSFNAFRGITGLKELDLSDTAVKYLPPVGLWELEVLKMTNTATLRTVPSIYDVRTMLQKAWMSYAIYCCTLSPPCSTGWEQDTEESKPMSATNNFLSFEPGGDSSNISATTDGSQFSLSKNPVTSWTYERDEDAQKICHYFSERESFQCWSTFGVLRSCEDLISWTWLKGGIWLVFLVALVGNILVLLVVSLTQTEKVVARFLMGNLAFADLCMALYLFLLATMDAVSSKTYYKYDYLWQRGFGCKIAGFLTIFSCQLSFFSLSLLTIERWVSIKRALYTNMLDTRMTSAIMTVGWLYALLMASLPLLGISSYSSSSVCLPVDIHDYPSFAYILVLLCTGGVSFLLMCFCYTQIYLSLSQETRRPRGKRSVATKMLILVGTNFLCWTPVAFFALSAVAGHPLINLAQSKVLLVLVYPINSCANPYLYVILTKQFKKDMINLLARHGLCKSWATEHPYVNEHYSRPMSHDTYQTTLLSTKSFVV